jgi:hypothetical protein
MLASCLFRLPTHVSLDRSSPPIEILVKLHAIATGRVSLGGVVLAAAIAFGLGAKDLAKEFLERRLANKSRDRAPDDLRHL